jgi:sugar/nucleoside kinase (ribokinase family)
VSALAAIGPLSRDVVSGTPARPGGTVFYAAATLARLGADAVVGASCAAADRELLLRPLEALGLPVRWYPSPASTSYRFHYEGERRVMVQEGVADPWPPEDAREAAGDARWVHVGALVRTDFPPETLAALAGEGRFLLLDGQGLVRGAALGPLRLERPSLAQLTHASVLKLDEEEADVLVGGDEVARLRSLGVPEVLLTRGSRGALVVTSSASEDVPAHDLAGKVDPTGAGDTFAAAYLVARSRGAEPVEAARDATDAVAAFLASR